MLFYKVKQSKSLMYTNSILSEIEKNQRPEISRIHGHSVKEDEPKVSDPFLINSRICKNRTTQGKHEK